jgi:hypothetical protein
MAWLAHRRTIDPDISGLNVALGQRPGFCHTGEEQPLVEALAPFILWQLLLTHGAFQEKYVAVFRPDMRQNKMEKPSASSEAEGFHLTSSAAL